MKIEVNVGVSQNSNHYTFDLDDLGVSKDEWESMSEAEKHDAVEKAVFDLPEQPYWMVDKFTEK